MNTINAAVGEGRELVVDSVKGYSGEHNAEMIAVDLSGFAGYDSYAIYIKTTPLGAVRRLDVGDDDSANPYIADGVMYIRLTSEFTCGGRLSLELEGVKIQDGVTVRELTSTAQIAFKPSMAAAAEKGEFGGGAETELRLFAVALAKRLTDLESRQTTLTEIPLAGETTVGGMKLTELSPIKLVANGVADYNYAGLNYAHLLVNLCAYMLVDDDKVLGVLNCVPSEEEYSLIDATCTVADGTSEVCLMTVERNGSIPYMNADYETVTLKAHMAALYIFKIVDGAMTVTECDASKMLGLLRNGVVADA